MERLLAFGLVVGVLGTPLFAQPPSQEPSGGEVGPITVSLKNAPVQEVLQQIARHADVTIALDVNLRTEGVVTIEVENLPWEAVFERVLSINGLSAEQQGPSLWVVRSRGAGERVLVAEPRG